MSFSNFSQDGENLAARPFPLDSRVDISNFSRSSADNASEMQDQITVNLSPASISMVIACFLLIVVTVGGNTLVILAFRIEPALQVITNHWIVSLALTDIILAVGVMPLQISRELFNGKWVFGTLACDLFISVDVLCCTCSIYHLCLISLDRYFCVRYPISYPRIRTPKATLTAICATWFWCISISFPRLFGWKDRRDDEHACYMTNKAYMLFSSAVSFYLPLLLICIMYLGIYRVTKAQSRKFACLSQSRRFAGRGYFVPEIHAEGFVSTALIASTLDAAMSIVRPSDESRSSEHDGGSSGAGVAIMQDPPTTYPWQSPTVDGAPSAPSGRLGCIDYLRYRFIRPNSSINGVLTRRSAYQQRKSIAQTSIAISQMIQTPIGTRKTPKPPSNDLELTSPNSPTATRLFFALPIYLNDTRKRDRLQRVRLSRKRQKQETKAAKVVVIVLAAFFLLWAPFFVVNVLAPVCGCEIGDNVWKLVTWLGYCNSSINPFIYTCFNRTFRRAFANVFKSCCRI